MVIEKWKILVELEEEIWTWFIIKVTLLKQERF
jgi:hypothetical protein